MAWEVSVQNKTDKNDIAYKYLRAWWSRLLAALAETKAGPITHMLTSSVASTGPRNAYRAHLSIHSGKTLIQIK